MTEKVSIVRVKVVSEDYEVEVEFTSESVAKAIEDVQAMLPKFKKTVLPPTSIQCPIHGCSMFLHKKEGQAWYSHQLDGGGWCDGVKIRE